MAKLYDYALRSALMGAGASILLGTMDGISTWILKDKKTLSEWTDERFNGGA